MTIFRASINIATTGHSLEQLNEYAGVEASRWLPIGSPVHDFDPTGPAREISQWHYDAPVAGDSEILEPHLVLLRPVLERMADAQLEGRVYGSLSVSLNSRHNAFVFEIEPRDTVLIARAGLRIRIDAYTPEG
ncbi:hypothetical protein [Conyzicola sp.]|uniref:hypothetical protein n=1 Tax=Conyzicola sp. TaxID=1969404 RepID=UPI003988A4C5